MSKPFILFVHPIVITPIIFLTLLCISLSFQFI